MNRQCPRTRLSCLFILPMVVLSLDGCSANQTPTTSATQRPENTALPTSTPMPAPEHRIGIRIVDGAGEFFDRHSGERFVPRGNNYVHLAPMSVLSSALWHSTLSPGFYDPEVTETMLRQMHVDGYNTVRVFLDCCREENNIGDPQGGLSKEYLDVVLDFLSRAKANEIYVLLDLSLTPADGGYNDALWPACNDSFQGDNCRYMTPGGLEAKRLFVQDVIQALIARGAPLDYVLAYGLENEMFFDAHSPPLTLSTGLVRAANGETYNLASPEDKQRIMDDAVVFFIDTLRSEILSLDPTALVTIGFFEPQSPNPARINDVRVIRTYPAIWDSGADFIDFHTYPGGELSLAKYVENFEMMGAERKPIIMGEYGASRHAFSSTASAAMALHDWQVESCNYGFDGWLLWTWDGHEQADFYNGLTDGGLINEALAPINRPDPCKPGTFSFFERNVAQGKEVRASRSLPNEPPSNVVNGDLGDLWGAGDFPVQWIEIDLGSPMEIRIIRLFVTQSPPGDTVHQIWVGPRQDSLNLLHVFGGATTTDQILEWRVEIPVENVRYVRVVTTNSPSWVGWNEVEVIGQ